MRQSEEGPRSFLPCDASWFAEVAMTLRDSVCKVLQDVQRVHLRGQSFLSVGARHSQAHASQLSPTTTHFSLEPQQSHDVTQFSRSGSLTGRITATQLQVHHTSTVLDCRHHVGQQLRQYLQSLHLEHGPNCCLGLRPGRCADACIHSLLQSWPILADSSVSGKTHRAKRC